MNQENGLNLRARLANPIFVTIVMAFVMFITPVIMVYHDFYQIYTAITWVIRTEQGEPLRVYLTLDQILAFERYLPKYLFLVMICRYYSNETTFKRALVIGIISEVYLLVLNNLGNLLYTLFPVPGIHPSSPISDIVLPFTVLTFLILVKLIPRNRIDVEQASDSWLNNQDSQNNNSS